MGSANQAMSKQTSARAAGNAAAPPVAMIAVAPEPRADAPPRGPHSVDPKSRMREFWRTDLLAPFPDLRRGLSAFRGKLDTATRLTGVGAGSLLLIVLIAAAAVNTGTNLLYLMLSSLLSLWVITIMIQGVNLARVDARRRMPVEIYAGVPVEIHYEATNNRRRFAAFGLAAVDRPPASEPTSLEPFFLSIAPGITAQASARATFTRRGWVELPDLLLVSVFPFGFLEARRRRSAATRALVYPEIIPLEAAVHRFTASQGLRESTRKGTGAGLYSIRNYVWGDSARSIHWKLSAKGAGVKVREFESEDTRRFRLILDAAPPAKPDPRALREFELAISVAASLARIFMADGYPTGVWTPGETVPAGHGPAHARRLLTALALLQWRDCVGGPRPPMSAPGSDVIDVPVSAWMAQARVIREAAERAQAAGAE